EGDLSDRFLGPALEGDRLLQRLAARPVGDEDVASGSAKVRRADLLELVLSVEVPEKQVHLLVSHDDELFLYLDPHAAVAPVREHARDVSRDQAGLADREGAEHADLLLDHRDPSAARGPAGTTRNDTLRLTCRSCSVFSSTSG